MHYISFSSFKAMFLMSDDNLRRYLKLFEDKGLNRIFSKNVTATDKEIVAVCLWINKMGVLPMRQWLMCSWVWQTDKCLTLWSSLIYSCSKPRQKPLTLTIMKKINLSRLRQFWVMLLMLTIAFAQQASGMWAKNQMNILMLPVRTVIWNDVPLKSFHSKRIKRT